jgi:UDP-N-acetyl-L-fucosamine synthase
MKVMTVVGTRPEIIRLSRVITALDRHLDHVLVHTGQNYDFELSDILFKDLSIRPPDIYLDAAGSTPAETIAHVIARTDAALRTERPDALLVLGDTNSCLAAIPAKRLRVPVFHMEAGNRCFDDRVPEEINRRIVDHTADVNLPYSDLSREYLLREGLPADRIIKTGSPMYEVLTYYGAQIDGSDVLQRLELTENGYFVVSAHREENIESSAKFGQLVDVLNALATEFEAPVIVTTHPRTRSKLEREGVELHPLVRLEKPFAFTDYVFLERNAIAVLSDSGTITEEASILNFPALNIREAHERPEGMEEAAVMLTGLAWPTIRHALEILAHQGRGMDRTLLPVRDYMTPNVSAKVVRIIVSYTDYVRRTVWRESTDSTVVLPPELANLDPLSALP